MLFVKKSPPLPISLNILKMVFGFNFNRRLKFIILYTIIFNCKLTHIKLRDKK
ncbi:hypothetical protein BBUWI9123_K0016 (plasmid) [Borreliella burgdorferi WI91-23]|nr:hypothetical protein BBUWI9123_K0016 [Borreliella burgdorferi WI91-23]